MDIRRAEECDIDGINRLLLQVLMVHHNGRPDLFKADTRKYTDAELREILRDDTRPVFVAHDESGSVAGYAFCMIKEYRNNNIMTDMKTLYIDDLCVDENIRGRHVGSAVYDHVLRYAESIGCYNVTLNVWECNPGAKKFYEHVGMKPQKTGMEKLL